MPAAELASRCPACRRALAADELACSLCGHLVPRPPGRTVAPPAPPDAFVEPAMDSGPWLEREPESASGPIAGISPPWSFLLIGALLAPLLTFGPLLRYVGWFLGSLCHETGHAAMGWFLGCPTIPAIRLDGHAAAVHQEPSKLLAALVATAIAALLWRDRARAGRRTLWIVLLLAQLGLAWTSAREAAFLFAGHLGELAFATFFLARAVSGGFTGSAAERATHAMVGWFLLGRNLWLSTGLIAKESVRDAYADSGSFGLVNDYLRLARETFGSSIAVPATITLVLGLLVVPLALALGRHAGD